MTDTRREVGRAATLIGAITIGSRLVGFGRYLVLVWAVGVFGVGSAYQTANTIPNLIFELVAGGAMAALVVPLLAAPLARRDPEQVRRVASALLTWVLIILVPIGALVAVFARPLVELLARGLSAADIDVGTEMLMLFAPQLPLYGIAIVLTGILQAHRRFAWPALAPLLSSLTMMAVYYAYATMSGRETDSERLDQAEITVLALGTTLGVAVLACCMFIPLRGLRLGLRPTWRLETGIAADLRALAIAGAITLGAQQLCQALFIALANEAGRGPVVVFTLSQTFFLLPWAVLAVPLATAAYPNLSEAHALADTERYQRTVSTTARLVMILSGLGVAALAGLSDPIATVLSGVGKDATSTQPAFSATLAGLAFGLFGYSMFAIYSRALYAIGRAYAAARATALGWAAAALAGIVSANAFAVADRTLAISVGWSIGMTVIGLALTVAVARHTGRASLAGFGRAVAATIVASAAAIGTARGLIAWWGHVDSVGSALIQGVTVGAATAAVYLGAAALLGGVDVLAVLRRRAGTIRPTDNAPTQNGDGQ